MYNERQLTPSEELFSNQAKQKIAELAVQLSDEFDVNDVSNEVAQCILDLNYSTQVLTSTVLDWEAYDIQVMMDFYSIECGLVSYPFRSFNDFLNLGTISSYVTIAQLNAVEQASIQRDNELEELIGYEINVEINAREDADDNLQAQIDALEEDFVNLTNLVNPILHSVSNLRFTGKTEYVEAGVSFYAQYFYWDSEGTPEDLVLTDNKGVIYLQSVVGNQHIFSIPKSYTLTAEDSVIWTLSGSNIDPINISSTSLLRSYYGKKTTSDDILITVTEADILSSGSVPGYSSLVQTNEGINFIPDTTKDEQGWIAVESAQAIAPYTYWRVDDVDNGNIASDGFILPPTTVIVNGRNYSVYRWRYRSPLSTNIRLSRNA